jgi:hypothetical protein
MPLPQVGGGYQYTDGNLSEVALSVQGAPGATTATSVTLSAADLTGGLYTSNNTAAVAITLPTAALTDALLTNAKVNSAFELVIINLGSGSGAVTMTAGTGWTLVGSATVAVTTSARFLARKTGDAAYTLYRIA